MQNIKVVVRAAVLYALLLHVAGCAADVMDSGDESDGDMPATDLALAPEEITNSRGRAFRRADMWDPAELDVINKNARVAALEETATLEQVADGLRGQMIGPGGRIYVEVEANIELAKAVLTDLQAQDLETESIEPIGPGATELRRVFGFDNRVNSSSTSGWQASIAFQEAGASGTRIGAHTMVTAAHTLYNNLDTTEPGWICRDGSASTTGCSSYPRWRFGVNGTSGHSSWIALGAAGCTATVSTAYMTLTEEASGWSVARYDYAVLDLSGCASSLFPNGRVWFGADILTDGELSALTGHNAGYPGRAPCPDQADGNSIDCATGTFQYSGTGPNFTGAKLFTSTSASISAGDSSSAYTIKSSIDSTTGQSGGPMYKLTSNGDHFLIGWLSNGGSTNRYRRWTSGMSDWVSDHSVFPDDN